MTIKKTKDIYRKFRLTEEEDTFICMIAKSNGYTNISDFIRTSIINPSQLVKKNMMPFLYEVNKIGVTNNQIARHANTQKSLDLQILEQLKEQNKLLEMAINTYR